MEESLTELEEFYEQIANSQEEKFKALEKHMNVIEKAHEKYARYQLKCSKCERHMNVIEKANAKSTKFQLKCPKCDFMGSSEFTLPKPTQ